MSDFIKQQPLILASASLVRRQLLQSLGLKFDVIPSSCDEEMIKKNFPLTDFTKLAATLAKSKALEISQAYPDHFIIAADQICVMGEQYFDKPGNHANAVQTLRQLRGQSHQQIAALCIAYGGVVQWQAQDIATLSLYDLSDELIEAYLLQEKPYSSCGAYNYEGCARWLFKHIEGHASTIMGLPLHLLIPALIDLNAVSF